MHPFLTAVGRAIPKQDVVSAWSRLNASLDVVFYDVAALSVEERAGLLAGSNREGFVLVVYPAADGRGIVALSPWEFVAAQQQAAGHDVVDTIVVAGVGSSDLGVACLARNVANHLGRPVAGIVPGFGLADVMTEAMGGWFVLGAANAIRDFLARQFDVWKWRDHVRDPEYHRHLKVTLETLEVPTHFIYGSPDSTTLLFLLLRLPGQFKCLVGHSKGNYSIENALEGLASAAEAARWPTSSPLPIVTLGAVVWFPPAFSQVRQFIGQIDGFGLMNSRPLVRRHTVPGAWHSLNTSLPGHLSVRTALALAEESAA